ncbi:MAG: hypothetical protein A2V65_07145 [Deltaproteobacteria bacterium RBG_13_49_15]|nr:MAG: hypothetical protein A2V65_07145 [Deltaproteobacteria bacterium RBG_13_49_15]
MYRIIFILAIIMLIAPISHAKEVSFSQEDRERLIRLETKVEEGFKALQRQIDSQQRQIDDLKLSTQRQIDDLKLSTQRQIDDLKLSFQKQFDNLYALILWGFGILFGGMGILIGFVIWDRRTALAPVVRKYKVFEERGELIEKALKEYARENPKFAEILKGLGIL